jgi:hypothetical protein
VGSFRKLLVDALITLHALVMLCGPSLHAIPGSGHHVEMGGSTGDRHEGQPGPTPHALSDHCLVCQFFTQAQLPVQTAHASTSNDSLILIPVDLGFFAPHVAPSVSRSRAPPLRVAGIA